MYHTAEELHIAIDNRLQQINSNRVKSVLPEYKDMRLNEAMLQFIETRVNSNLNPIHEGFTDSIKRYDDIQELLRTVTVPVYIDNNKVLANLPADYYKLVSSSSVISYNCNSISYNQIVPINIQTIVVPFLTDNTGIGGKYYTNFVMNIDGSIVYSSAVLGDIYDPIGKFLIINHIIEVFNNNPNYDIYWEQYLTHYEPGCFIIVPKVIGNITSGSIIYNGVSTNGTLTSYSYSTYSNTIFSNTKTVKNGLGNREYVDDMLNNYYYNKSMYRKPIATIQEGSLNIYYNNKFIIKEVNIDYIKRPRLINYKLNTTCELDNAEVIVAIAVENILADKSYNINLISNINQLKS